MRRFDMRFFVMKIKLLGKNLEELKQLVKEEGLPGFAAGQIARWLYVRKARSIDEMTDLSKAAREKLSQKYEIGVTPYSLVQESSDGTKKYMFPVSCSHRSVHLTCPAGQARRQRLSKRGRWKL